MNQLARRCFKDRRRKESKVIKVRINKLLLTSAVIFTSLFTFACGSTNGTGTGATTGGSSDNATAATVNGKAIPMSEVERVLSTQAQGRQAQLSPLELAAARLQVVEGLIQREVLFQRAEKEKLLPSEDEITQAVAAFKQQRSLTDEAFQRLLKESNQTDQAFREEVRRELALRKLQERTAAKVSSVSDREVEEYFNTNKEQFVIGRGVGLAMIVADPQDNGLQNDAKSETEATAKISQVYQRIRGGADFADVAREQSEDASNVRGGDIGFATEEQLRQNRFPQAVITQLFNMQAGDTTEPVRFEDGRIIVFKLTSKRLQSENQTLESPGVREEIQRGLISQRQSLLNEVLVALAMREAKVENNLAQNIYNNPTNLSGLRPAGANAVASPNSSPNASASPNTNANTQTPATTASPAATSSPR